MRIRAMLLESFQAKLRAARKLIPLSCTRRCAGRVLSYGMRSGVVDQESFSRLLRIPCTSAPDSEDWRGTVSVQHWLQGHSRVLKSAAQPICLNYVTGGRKTSVRMADYAPLQDLVHSKFCKYSEGPERSIFRCRRWKKSNLRYHPA